MPRGLLLKFRGVFLYKNFFFAYTLFIGGETVFKSEIVEKYCRLKYTAGRATGFSPHFKAGKRGKITAPFVFLKILSFF